MFPSRPVSLFFFQGNKLFNDTLNFIFKNVTTFNCYLIPQHVILIKLLKVVSPIFNYFYFLILL